MSVVRKICVEWIYIYAKKNTFLGPINWITPKHSGFTLRTFFENTRHLYENNYPTLDRCGAGMHAKARCFIAYIYNNINISILRNVPLSLVYYITLYDLHVYNICANKFFFCFLSTSLSKYIYIYILHSNTWH